MKPVLVREAILTFLSGYLANLEDRPEDADHLTMSYKGSGQEYSVGLTILASFLAEELSVERGEALEETLRAVISRMAEAEITFKPGSS